MKSTIILFASMLAACGSSPGGGGDGGGGGPDGGGGTCDPACGGDTPFCVDGTCVACELDEQCPAEAPLCRAGACIEGCAGSEAQANLVTRPPDIIWVVDQSGSMDQETAYVQDKIDDFVSIIDASGIDYRVVMIADPQADNAICVPEPLAGPSCGNNTRFRLVDREIRSHDGPQAVIEEYARYSDFLRTDSLKHIVFVTDDDSDMSAAAFTAAVNALQPAGSFEGFRVHGIYAFGSGSNGCTGPFGSGAADGTVYTTLIAQTGGAAGVICTGNWDQVFADIQASVISGAEVACNLAIPAPPDGQTLDPSTVNVRYLAGGVSPGTTLPRVDSAAACGASGGWYYDDPANPTQIILCDATCTTIQGDTMAAVQVEFGCGQVVD
jgi:hypothetical protein